MSVTPKSFLKYTMMPGILPRLSALFRSGLAPIAMFIAYVFKNTRLLPGNHAYFNPANAGKFGIRHVIAEAHKNLKHTKKNIDQIIIFYTMVVGLILLFIQFGFMLFAMTVPMAQAAGVGEYWGQFFGENDHDPTYDIAFRFMDRIFGIPGIFGSCLDQGLPCIYDATSGTATGPSNAIPNNFHKGLHQLFLFYNYGLLAIALIIFLYLVTTVVAETAQSGTPFGKRFNHFWAPVRMIFAVALLTPLYFNFNGAQLLTLYAAKAGSNLATNTWGVFNDSIGGATPMGNPENLLAQVKPPPFNTLVGFMYVAHVCREMEILLREGDPKYNKTYDVNAYIVTDPSSNLAVIPFLHAAAPMSSISHVQAVNFSLADKKDSITIRFGEYDQKKYPNERGFVSPYCGEISFNIKEQVPEATATFKAPYLIQERYYDILKGLWEDEELRASARGLVLRTIPNSKENPMAQSAADNRNFVVAKRDFINYAAKHACDTACTLADIDLIAQATGTGSYAPDWSNEFMVYGWGGAGIWYNKIADVNGRMVTAAYNVPVAAKYPYVMEKVLAERRKSDTFLTGRDRFVPGATNDQEMQLAENRYRAETLSRAHAQWNDGFDDSTSNIFYDSIIALFGLQGLMDMQENVDIHPMAKLVALGKALVDSAISNFGFSFGAGVFGGVANLLGQFPLQTVGQGASSFLSQVAFIGLSIGFVLYYIIPFMPFIYFFFAVATWAKSLFEAMIGLPLWAMAHIRIDGEGLPGPTAMNGYYMIFEIFLRPTLIVFGLVVSMIIFAAQVTVLHDVWETVVANLVGHSPAEAAVGTIEKMRSKLDQFFYTIIYTILVYMIGMSSFKLIDLIPDNILRWMGASVSSFSEMTKDPADRLVQFSLMGANRMGSQMQGAMGSLSSLGNLQGRNS